MIDFEAMREKARSCGVNLNESQLIKLDKYAEVLVDWNNRMNLTAITDPEGIVIRHFEDSLSFFKFIDLPDNSTLIDVGTGAGFPGMVLKIARPDLKMTLLDSLSKRISFLEAVSKEIDENVLTVHMRAEDGSQSPQFREKFDFACARAVSNLRVLSEYCIPFVKVGGQFVSMKGPDASEELNQARAGIGTLGGRVAKIAEYTISDGSGRTMIVIDKCKPTPAQFPRSSAKINKKPI